MNSIITLDYQSRTPIYLQIEDQIERFVALGILKPKEQIPSIRELASSLGINPNTVKKAYSELEHKKIITTVSTKGTFIVDQTEAILKDRIREELVKIKGEIIELTKLGITKEDIIEYLKKEL